MSIKRVTTRAIDNGQITADKIADESVILSKIAVGAVDSTKIADNAVIATKIASSAVTESKIDALAVSTSKVADAAITDIKLAANAVGSGNIIDGAVIGSKLGLLSVGTAAIAANAVNSDKIADGSVGSAEIADAAITAAKLSGAQSGSAPIYGARAWVNFNGTGTVAIRASGNVSSITDGGIGTYTVNFTTAMPDTNYSVCITSRRVSANDFNFGAMLKGTTSAGTNYPLTTTSFEIISGTVSNSTFADTDVVCISVFR